MLCIMGLFAILSSTMSKTLLNPLATILRAPTDWSGLIGAASTIPGILVSLPASSLSDVYGRRRFLLMAGFVFATAPFFYLFINAWWQLALVRFYHGFATAIFVPVAEASMVEMFPAKRGERISLFTSATYIGRGIAPFLGGYILFATGRDNDPLYNYHIMYMIVGSAGLAAFIMTLLLLAGKKQPLNTRRPSSAEALKHLYRGWGTIARNRAVLMVSLIQASLYYAYGAVDYFLSGYLKDTLHFDYFSAAAVTGSLIVLAILVRPYMGRLSDRRGRRFPVIVGLVTSAISLVAVPFFSDLPVLFLLALIYGFGFATATASTTALVTELSPKELIGTSTGFLDTVMDIGQTAGPIVSGFVLGTYLGYYAMFPSLSIVLLFACAVFVFSKVARVSSDF
jgi:MFS family permease